MAERSPRSHRSPAADEDLDDEGLPLDRPKGVLRGMLNGLLTYGIVILVVAYLLPRLKQIDFEALFARITTAQVLVILALGIANLLTNLPPLMITLPGLRLSQGMVTNTASAALSNTVPEGGAVATGLNFAMLRSWGFDLPQITSSFLTTGLWTNLVRYGVGAVALVLMVVGGEGSSTIVTGAAVLGGGVAIAIVLLIQVLRREAFARRLGRLGTRVSSPALRLARRPPLVDLEEKAAEFRRELAEQLQARWHELTAAMAISQLTACLVLGVAVRVQGIDASLVSWPRIVVAYCTMTLASLVAPTPGGIGVAEVALIAVIGANVPDVSSDAVLAAVVLYRIATWLLPIPIGAGSYLFWRQNQSWRTTAEHG